MEQSSFFGMPAWIYPPTPPSHVSVIYKYIKSQALFVEAWALCDLYIRYKATTTKRVTIQRPFLGNRCINRACYNGETVFSGGPFLEGVIWKLYWIGVQFSSVCKKGSLLEWRREIQSGISLLWRIRVVEEFAENSCGWGTETVREPRGIDRLPLEAVTRGLVKTQLIKKAKCVI
jgi:hypothetical protein